MKVHQKMLCYDLFATVFEYSREGITGLSDKCSLVLIVRLKENIFYDQSKVYN